ncbi:GNAT family N-acetyltransferase [Legionella bozemanae]|uniref:GNAT family N-acetyltransferase n=1 Tax=Legionella bozemanae TaxID=447 RepID=UPI003EED5625
MNAESNISKLLNELSNEVSRLYGYVKIAGDNFDEPAINSGPCGPFAYAFFKLWNQKFIEKVTIVFIMVKNSDECWHTLIRLPDGSLFDGGYGVRSDEKYRNQFDIEDMLIFDINLLEKCSYGLNREYPRYCSNFSIKVVENLIGRYLNLIDKNIIFQKINRTCPLLETVIKSSIGSPTLERIKQALQDYELPNRFLIGAFSSQTLIAVIGYELKGTQAIIKHISVIEAFKKEGIGKTLIQLLINDCTPNTVTLETDDESVGFYKNIGFICTPFKGNYGVRYNCIQDLSSYLYSRR